MHTIRELLPLRRRRFGPPGRRSGGPRVLLIGGEQALSLGWVMANLNPDLSVVVVSDPPGTRRLSTESRLLFESDRYDAVFVEIDRYPRRDMGPLVRPGVPDGVTLVPKVTFRAYHPDLVRVGDGHLRRGPMGTAHSALALFGYLAGLSPGATAELFRPEVYERVGYLRAWDACGERLRELGAWAGLDLSAPLARWTRRGCFMHGPDQMRLYAVADLARGLLDGAGVPYHACDLAEYLPDDPGAGESWPVYPGIATHYGIPGSALFLRPIGRRSDRSGPVLTLGAFIAESFASYALAPVKALACPRVAAWRGDPELDAWLRRLAVRGGGAAMAGKPDRQANGLAGPVGPS